MRDVPVHDHQGYGQDRECLYGKPRESRSGGKEQAVAWLLSLALASPVRRPERHIPRAATGAGPSNEDRHHEALCCRPARHHCVLHALSKPSSTSAGSIRAVPPTATQPAPPATPSPVRLVPQDATPRPVARTVFVTPAGNCYHASPGCRTLKRSGTINEVPMDTAVSRGLRPCKVCGGG